MKDRGWTIGMLLIGTAAVGAVTSSWIKYSDQQHERLRQQAAIRECTAKAREVAASGLETVAKAGFLDTAARDAKGVWEASQRAYESYYVECLRLKGIDR